MLRSLVLTSRNHHTIVWQDEMKCQETPLRNLDPANIHRKKFGCTSDRHLATLSVSDTLCTKLHWSSKWRNKSMRIWSCLLCTHLFSSSWTQEKIWFRPWFVACTIFFSSFYFLFCINWWWSDVILLRPINNNKPSPKRTELVSLSLRSFFDQSRIAYTYKTLFKSWGQ